jgi:hypothetical protein
MDCVSEQCIEVSPRSSVVRREDADSPLIFAGRTPQPLGHCVQLAAPVCRSRTVGTRDHRDGTRPVVAHIDTFPVGADRHRFGVAGHVDGHRDGVRDRVDDRECAISEVRDVGALSVGTELQPLGRSPVSMSSASLVVVSITVSDCTLRT